MKKRYYLMISGLSLLGLYLWIDPSTRTPLYYRASFPTSPPPATTTVDPELIPLDETFLSEAREAQNMNDRINVGRKIYLHYCLRCHQHEGQGQPGEIPPLFASDYLNKNLDASILAVNHGLSGPIRVNLTDYEKEMPNLHLPPSVVAAVVTFITSSWHNVRTDVTTHEVIRVIEKAEKSHPSTKSP